jgi:hypothetical protein
MTAYRSMLDDDLDFVVSGWSSSFRLSPFAGLIDMRTYADVMHRQIAEVLARPSTVVTVAYEPGEIVETPAGPRPFAYGFLAQRTDLAAPYVYYVYVKAPYREGRRRLGLELGHAAALFEAAGIDPRSPFRFACRTVIGDQLARKVPLAEWDPLPARFERPQ